MEKAPTLVNKLGSGYSRKKGKDKTNKTNV